MFQIILFLIFSISLQSQENILSLRNQFYKASEDSKEAEAFQKRLSLADEKNPILLGYRGMSELLLAKHTYNPYSKLNYFKKGKTLLEKAIALDSHSPELRWLRFSVQANAPAALAYNSNMMEDKNILMQVLLKQTKVDDDLKSRIYNYVLKSNEFTKEEKEKIRKNN
jgi:hypothetical protein